MSVESPGIRFESAPPPLAETLPRMDVAAFVGFAEQGPIGVPVPVEDVERFRDVFGDSVELARDERTGRMDRSYLLPAVDAFFRNGGRRCWIVRVGEKLPSPSQSRFRIPGLIAAAPDGTGGDEFVDPSTCVPAVCRARAQGSGFDEHRVGTVLRQRVFPRGTVTRPESPGSDADGSWLVDWGGDEAAPEDEDMLPGELLRVAYPGDWYLEGIFDPVAPGAVDRIDLESGARVVRSREVTAFRRRMSPFHEVDRDPPEWTVDGWFEDSDRDRDPDFTGATLRRVPDENGESSGRSFTLSPGTVVDGADAGPWTVWLTVRGPASAADAGLRVRVRSTGDSLVCDLLETTHPVDPALPGADGSDRTPEGSFYLRCRFDEDGGLPDYRLGRVAGPTEPTESVFEPGVLVRCREPVSGRTALLALGGETGGFSLPGAGSTSEAWSVREDRWAVSPADVPEPAEDDRPPSITRLRMDLLTWHRQELVGRIRDLGFSALHPRGWMHLPTDGEIFAFVEAEHAPPEPGTFEAEVFAPRPAWAGPVEAPDWSIPLGMSDRLRPERTRGRREDGTTRMERDGVATFEPGLFVDGDLATAHTDTLARAADRRVYVEQTPLPDGLHGLWPVREATLLALPDVLHRDWIEKPRADADRTPRPSPVPRLEVPEVTGRDPLRIVLTWTVPSVEGTDPASRIFELEEATDPEFLENRVRYGKDDYRVEETARSGEDGPVDAYALTRYVRETEPQELYFRVRLRSGERSGDRPGAWSVTRREVVPEADFSTCGTVLAAPEVSCAPTGTTSGRISFERLPDEEGVGYEVQIARDPAFEILRTISCDPSGWDDDGTGGEAEAEETGDSPCEPGDGGTVHVPLSDDRPALTYVRVRAVAGRDGERRPGPWSCTMIRKRALPKRRVLIEPETYDEPGGTDLAGREALLRVQRAALRFAAARGDVLVVLGLPEHDEGREIRTHVRRLTGLGVSDESGSGGFGGGAAARRSGGGRLRPDETRTLSFGALYHPWIRRTAGDADRTRPVPPDGAIVGATADRSLARGAWFPPANVALEDGRTLIELRADPERLPDRINLLRETPRGVLTLDAATLATDRSLRPLPARRVLSLIRRLAEREGPELVFDSAGPRLRSRIAERFDVLLRRLFEQGALAGTVPAEGYRVVADESVNPPERLERGKIVVELRVAPTRPLEFLTVRLVQRGPGSLVPEAA